MPEIVEQTTTTRTRWYSGLLTPQNVILLISVITTVEYFVFKTNLTNKSISGKADEKEITILKEQIKDLEDRVNRQYGAAKEDREKENAAIEEVADWKHYEQGRQAGYKQAMEEVKKK
jgi:flagellar biosynthesis/type III secretory pathway protein FliH